MTIICWGNLAKSADSTQRIEQAIEEYIGNHDSDPNAHMGEDYALGVHRLQVVLDHSPYSIFNSHTYPQARVYKALVDPSGNGDTTGIQEAINYVHSMNGGVVMIKNGTYYMTSDITMYGNVEIIGEDKTDTIIDFQDQLYGIMCKSKTDIKIQNLTIKNSTKNAIEITDNLRSSFIDINFQNNQRDIYIGLNNNQLSIKNIYSENSTDSSIEIDNYSAADGFIQIENVLISEPVVSGILLYAGYYNYLKNCIVKNAGSDGIYIEGSNLDGTTIVECQAQYCTGKGINIVTGDRLLIINCQSRNNDGDGIYLGGFGESIVNNNIIMDNGGYGINLSANTSNNTVVGNNLHWNTSGNIIDSGTGNTVTANDDS